MRLTSFLTGLILLSTGVLIGHAVAQEETSNTNVRQDDEQEVDLRAPGPQHEAMAVHTGTYSQVSTIVVPAIQAPQLAKATANVQPICGGRFMMEEAVGELNGRPYACWRLWGYNNETQQYESVWVDTLSTGITFVKESARSADGKEIELRGTVVEDGAERNVRAKINFFNEDQMIVERYQTANGGEFRYRQVYDREQEDR